MIQSKMLAIPPKVASAISPSIPHHIQSRLVWLPDSSRSMGIHIMAGKGSGKSRLMGRVIAWLDFLRGIPLVIFDPHGPTIDNFLDKMTRLPKELQEQLWQRVVYVDMSGHCGMVFPFPLYYRLGGESLYEISQRYLDVVRKLDPYLQTASIEGWNPLWRIGTHAGMLLAALNFQITEAQDLVTDPSMWRNRFTRALHCCPDAKPVAEFFDDFMNWREDARDRRSDSFLNKIALFTLDPMMKAMFGASTPGIDWKHVVNERLTVLLDFRHEHDIERRRFKMLWAFHFLLTFIKYRGAGRHRPISLIIDELTSLFSSQTMASDLFASDLDELINVLARNYMVWLTLAHQELFQLDERAQKALMAMGTQILGVTSDRDAALSMARQFFRFDPYWVKKHEPIYATSYGISQVIDYRSVEFTIEEQELLKSYNFSDQGRYHFLVRPALSEGNMNASLRPVTWENFDQDLYVNQDLVAQARELLMQQRGQRVRELLHEIDARLGDNRSLPSAAIRTQRSHSSDTIILDGNSNDDENNPIFGEKKAAADIEASRAA